MKQRKTLVNHTSNQQDYNTSCKNCKFHLIKFRVNKSNTSEDATQETFLKAVRYLDTTGFKGEFRPFIYKIARNTCIDLARKRCQDDTNLEELEQEPGYLEAGFEQTEDDVWLQQLIRNLDSEVQEILLLRFGQNLTIRETAQTMGLPLRTVQSKLRSILKKLKTEFQQMDGKQKGG